MNMMNLSVINTVLEFCFKNKLRVTHAVDLYDDIRDDLEWDDDIATSDGLKNALISMKTQREYLYGFSYKELDEWINAL